MDNAYFILAERQLQGDVRRYDIRARFYHAFREVTDQKLSANGHKGVGTVVRAERVLEDVITPTLLRKDKTPEQVIAAIESGHFLRAMYVAAGEQNTRFFGKQNRAVQAFDRHADGTLDHQVANFRAQPGGTVLIKRPETLEWIAMVRQQLRPDALK